MLVFEQTAGCDVLLCTELAEVSQSKRACRAALSMVEGKSR